MHYLRPKRLVGGILRRTCRYFRNFWFSSISNNSNIKGTPQKNQPILMQGKGKIEFGRKVNIGVENSPLYWNTYCYLECRNKESFIYIGDSTWINNSFTAISEKRSIKIGSKCLIGHGVLIIDSNFHSLDPKDRHSGGSVSVGDVEILDNVFIGSNVTILKNTKIGAGCVVGAGAVVSGIFPPNCLIAGNPAIVKRHL